MEYIQNYEIFFRKFKREHPEKSETEFVIKQIEKFQNELEKAESEYSRIDTQKIKKSVIKEFELDFDQFPEKGYHEKWVNWKIQQELNPIENRIGSAKRLIDEYKIKLSRLPDSTSGKNKESETNLLKGKKLNLLERYEIAKRVLNIEKQIRILHISENEKYNLLSLILGCNRTNARHIMNGKYPGKIREDLITEYVQDLKK